MVVLTAAGQNSTVIVADWRNPTLASLGLHGPVKHMRIEQSAPGQEPRIVKQCSFDPMGRATECTDFELYQIPRTPDAQKGESRTNNQPKSRTVYHYDENGNSAGYDIYNPSAGPDRPQKIRYKLDSQGRRTEQLNTQTNGDPGTRFTYTYDSAGNLLEEKWYSWQDQRNPAGLKINKYNENGQLTDEEYKDANDVTSSRVHNQYNAAGQISETRKFAAGQLVSTTVFSYDDHGRKSSAVTTTTNPTRNLGCDHCLQAGRVTYAYDSSGRITNEISYDADGQLLKITHSAFDEHGNPIELDAFQTSGSPQSIGAIKVKGKPVSMKWSNGMRRITYTYDSHGNWTRADETTVPQFDLSGPRTAFMTQTRTLEYYGNDSDSPR